MAVAPGAQALLDVDLVDGRGDIVLNICVFHFAVPVLAELSYACED